MAKKPKKVNESYNDLVLYRSNALIESKHNCSLMENKLIALSLAMVKIDNKGVPYAEVPVSTLKQFEGIEITNVYKKVKEVAQNITKHTVIVEEQLPSGTGRKLEVFTLVNNVEYKEDGSAIFKIKFNPSIVPMITNLQGNYSKHRVKCLMSFGSNYAYRLYELLSVKEYLLYPKNKKDEIPYVDVRFESLNDLKMQLTLISVDDDSLKPLLSKPYEELKPEEKKKLDKVLDKALYKRWSDFKSMVLDNAQKQLEENPICPIKFTYTPIKSGRGGKVTGIVFRIYKNDKYVLENEAVKESFSSEETMYRDRIDEVRRFMLHENIADISIVKLLEVADYDVKKIKDAYDLALQQDSISNLVGWMSQAIKEGWAYNKNVAAFKNRTPEEAEKVASIYDDYLTEMKGYEEAQQYTFDFESNEVVVEAENVKEIDEEPEQVQKGGNINPRFFELFMKSTSGDITPAEREEMQMLVAEIAKNQMK